jgi:Family of unknown function (DUF5824)
MDAVRELLKKMAQVKTPKDEETGLPKRYVAGLSDSEKKQQATEIQKSQKHYKETGEVKTRPVIGSTSKRSPHVVKFENRYGFPITDLGKVRAMFPGTKIDTILAKGRAAYASGSRPGQTSSSWAYARLASVLTGGKALAVDKDLVNDADLKKITAKKK